MQRIYYPELQESSQEITLKQIDIIHQLTKVLRIKIGENIILFNGKESKDYIFEVSDISKREIILKKTDSMENNSEINYELHLYNAIPNKLEKIEYIIQKGTEIGFSQFVFFRSERSQKINISPNKMQRLEKIIIEAAEQSGRSKIPSLIIHDENNIYENIPTGKNIFFHTKNENSFSLQQSDFHEHKKINLFVGPEGGWSDSEVEILEQNMERVHLGNRILRTETTGIVTGFYIIQSK